MPSVLFAQLWKSLLSMPSFFVIIQGPSSNLRMLSHCTTHLNIKDWWAFFIGLCESTSPPVHPHTKSWVLALQWALWKGRNDFIFKGTKINPRSTILYAGNLILQPMDKSKEHQHEDSLRSPRGTVLVFSNASFRGMGEKLFFGFAICIDGL